MNSTNFTYLLQNPENIHSETILKLEEVITEFPYFQAARAIQLKELNKTNSFKYNIALKRTATHTIDRKVLFNFITSPLFIKKESIPQKEKNKGTNIKNVQKISENTPKEKASTFLEIGKPIPFSNIEPHSFNEWMQLISKKPILREKTTANFSLIDTFIKENPKIKPANKNTKYTDISIDSSSENKNLMTETLAKVYLEQNKFENAIKAYRILSLKYPEKSGFFADRIKAIRILQKSKL